MDGKKRLNTTNARRRPTEACSCYAGMADSYMVAWGWNSAAFEGGLQKAKAVAEKASNSIRTSQCASGDGRSVRPGNGHEAERELRPALWT